jgi:hypothetical protein
MISIFIIYFLAAGNNMVLGCLSGDFRRKQKQ